MLPHTFAQDLVLPDTRLPISLRPEPRARLQLLPGPPDARNNSRRGRWGGRPCVESGRNRELAQGSRRFGLRTMKCGSSFHDGRPESNQPAYTEGVQVLQPPLHLI